MYTQRTFQPPPNLSPAPEEPCDSRPFPPEPTRAQMNASVEADEPVAQPIHPPALMQPVPPIPAGEDSEIRPSRPRAQTGSSTLSTTPSSGSINSRMPPPVVVAAEMSRASSSGSARVRRSPVDGDDTEEQWRAIVAAGGRRGSALAEEYTRDLSLGRGELEAVQQVDEDGEGEEEDVDGPLRDLQRELAEIEVSTVTPTRRPSVFSLRHQLATLSVDPLHHDPTAAHRRSSVPAHEAVPSALPLASTILEDGRPGQADHGDPVSPISTADFVVAVVGPRHVGKSSVIRRGLRRPLADPVVVQEDEQGNRVTTSTTSFSIGGQRRAIEVLEIDEGLLRYSEEGVVWPNGLSQCEAAMLWCGDSVTSVACTR